MRLKDSTVRLPDNPDIARIVQAVEAVYSEFGLEPTCTSGNERTAKHMPTSMHYCDRALDIRFWDVLDAVASRIRAKLPAYYDVVREKDHFHIESDPTKQKETV
jgi:hypothetical protein